MTLHIDLLQPYQLPIFDDDIAVELGIAVNLDIHGLDARLTAVEGGGTSSSSLQWTTSGATVTDGTQTYWVPVAARGKATLQAGNGIFFYDQSSYTFNVGKTQITFVDNAHNPAEPGVPVPLEFFYSDATLVTDGADAGTLETHPAADFILKTELRTDNFVGAGATGPFTLSFVPVANSLRVFVDGLRCQVGVHYTVAGNVITFAAVVPAGWVINTEYIG